MKYNSQFFRFVELEPVKSVEEKTLNTKQYIKVSLYVLNRQNPITFNIYGLSSKIEPNSESWLDLSKHLKSFFRTPWKIFPTTKTDSDPNSKTNLDSTLKTVEDGLIITFVGFKSLNTLEKSSEIISLKLKLFDLRSKTTKSK
uniref:Uncharacterized protein n=1 Tax=Caulerpa verticillata TaxID=177082 RepID=A0A386B0A2_9CHLO|nr:hypothetical protein [Caulerpa verticillata]AYC65125.1 hypothetical protein [Caulerpa verticillata]